MGTPLVDLAASHQAIQAYSADKAVGNLQGRMLVLEKKGGKEVLVYRNLNWYEPIVAFFRQSPSSAKTILEFCSKNNELVCPEIETLGEKYTNKRSFGRALATIFHKTVQPISLSPPDKRSGSIKEALKNNDFKKLLDLGPSTQELFKANFSSDDHALDLFMHAFNNRDPSLVKAMISALPKEFLLQPRREDKLTVFHVLAASNKPEILAHAMAKLNQEKDTSYPYLADDQGRTPIDFAPPACKKLLEDHLENVLVNDFKEYQANWAPKDKAIHLLNPRHEVDQIMKGKSNELLFKWALENYKTTLLLTLMRNVPAEGFPRVAESMITRSPYLEEIVIDFMIQKLQDAGAFSPSNSKEWQVVRSLVIDDMTREPPSTKGRIIPKLIGKVPAKELAKIRYNDANEATSLLFWASLERPRPEIVRALFKNGYTMDDHNNQKGDYGRTALHSLCGVIIIGEPNFKKSTQETYLEVLKVFIESSKNKEHDLNLPTDNEGYTPLHLACEKGNDQLAELLLQYKAVDREQKTKSFRYEETEFEGQTALQVADMEMKEQFKELFEKTQATLD